MLTTNQVKFTVLIESSAAKPWNVALWHNFNSREKWSSLALQQVDEPQSVV
jgi:hypothetical protein